MLSLLLVEDESIELDYLKEHIDWSNMGIRIVGTAKNGRSAWEQIQMLQPDIVLTDVRMPIMDGLKLGALIQEKYNWIKIIFLSGHDEFSYVKSALSAGAVGYLLKPIDPLELSTVMGKVKEEVGKSRLLKFIAAGTDPELSRLDLLPLERITLADIPRVLEEVSQYFTYLKKLSVPEEQVHKLLTSLLTGISGEWSKYEDRTSAGIGELEDWCQAITQLDTLSGIEAYVLELLRRIEQYLVSKRQDPHLRLMQQVVDRINDEYAEPLTIEYLAGKVYLSPNYLRALFKEKWGCTVHVYLTQVRLKKAVDLLRDRTLRVHDVARKVGYDNTSYFCTIFYKYQGVTPNEYRKRFL